MRRLSDDFLGDFLDSNESNTGDLVSKIEAYFSRLSSPNSEASYSRRVLDDSVEYRPEIEAQMVNQKSLSSDEVLDEFDDMLQGCFRHQGKNNAFNMITSPLFDVIAGITVTNMYNPNALWDFLAGKIPLYEKKLVRMLGSLVNWPKADGLVVTGGKQTLIYAIRNGMMRCDGVDYNPADCVVFCSELAHYSIAHCCHFLGMPKENCIRVRAKSNGEVDCKALHEAIDEQLRAGKKIAAVIAVGGGTVNLIPDPICEVKSVIVEVAVEHHLPYLPYMHVDSVISWTWLAFAKSPDKSWREDVGIDIQKKIDAVVSKIEGIECADSFGADFHKTAFCPYASAVFVTKSFEHNGFTQNVEMMSFGQNEVYKDTLENSRAATGIVAAWIALRRMGLEGLREFLLYQMKVCQTFKNKMAEDYSDHFEVINHQSLGWEIVFKPHFDTKQSWSDLCASSNQDEYLKQCQNFLNHVWFNPIKTQNFETPVIGFVKSFAIKHGEKQLPAFLIHPTSLHYDDKSIDEMLSRVVKAKSEYIDQTSDSLEDDFLSSVVPPK